MTGASAACAPCTAPTVSTIELKKLVMCPSMGSLMVDHTLLGNNDTPQQVEELIKQAVDSAPRSVAICIHIPMIPHAKVSIAKRPGCPLLIATVVNFPLGRDPMSKVVADTKTAVGHGADEVDLVIDYALIKRNKEYGLKYAEQLVAAVRAVCPREKVLLKVIIESGELATPELIIGASMAAMKGGCDFIKTSTGKVPVNATLETAKIMLQCIACYQAVNPSRDVGFKPAGGVKTPLAAVEFLQVAESIMGRGWLNYRHFRFGASSLLAVLRQAVESPEGMAAASDSPPTAGY